MPLGDWRVEIELRVACDFFRFTLLRSASFKSADSRSTRLRFNARPRRSSEIGPAQPGSTIQARAPARRRGVEQARRHGMNGACSQRFNHSLRCCRATVFPAIASAASCTRS